MELESILAIELKKIDALKAQGLFEEATKKRKELIAKTGSEELVRQRENRTLAETQAEAMAKLGQAADAFLGIMDAIKSVFDGIATIARTIMKLFGAFTLAGGNMGKAFTGVKNTLGGITKILKSVTGQADKVATATMKATGTKVSGEAVKSTAKAATKSTAKTATKNIAQSGTKSIAKAATKSSGVMGKIGGFFGKMNPLKQVGSVLKGKAGKLLKFPFISGIIETIFAGQDIKNIIAEGGNKNDIYSAIGKRTAEAIGAIGGTAILGALGSSLGPIGTIAGGILGDTAGRWVGGKLSEVFGSEGLGKFVSKTFGYEDLISKGEKSGEINVEDFTIKTHPKDTLLMAGGTKFGDETNALLKELISAVKQGGNVFLDSTKVGTALSVGTYKVQ